MRKLIKGLFLLIIILIVVAVMLPFIIPVDTYKKEIVAQVKTATGRDLVIAGDMKATLFPVLGIELGQVSLSNPEGYSSKYMLQVDSLTLDVDVAALLNKELQVKRFLLSKPIINLETNAAGKPNWEFTAAPSAPAPAKQAAATDNDAASAVLGSVMLGAVKISDGEIYYRDGKTKQAQSLTALNLDASLPGLSQPFKLEGSAVWNKQKLSIDGVLANPADFVTGKASGLKLSVNSDPLTMHYDGFATKQGAKGTLDLAVPSIPDMVQWAGSAAAFDVSKPLALKVKGDLDATTQIFTLANSEISLDDIEAKGHVRANISGKVPMIEANLNTGILDVNPYLPQKQAFNDVMNWIISPAMAAPQWSSERIDLSGLRAANANVNLTASGIVYENFRLGRTVVNTQLTNGLMVLTIPEAALYEGEAKAAMTLDAAGALSHTLSLAGVQAAPLLKAASGDDPISGTLNMSANIKGTMLSVRDLIQSLNGNGVIRFNDGAIKGLDLAGMVRNVKSAFKEVDTSQQKTDFTELGGTFTIDRGVISNNDLSLKAPLLRLSGEGTVNLPLYTVNYRVTPMVVASLKGQGGKDKQGLEVPIIVSGSLDNPRYTPDLAGMAQKALENPEAIKNTVDSFKEQLKDGKTDLKDVKENLKGLFQGFKK